VKFAFWLPEWKEFEFWGVRDAIITYNGAQSTGKDEMRSNELIGMVLVCP
jgi:hypothetical protein